MLHLESPSHPAGAATEFALWNLGSRPFYLLASVFAALSVLLWTFEYAGPPLVRSQVFRCSCRRPCWRAPLHAAHISWSLSGHSNQIPDCTACASI
jgi:hypothetical protein